MNVTEFYPMQIDGFYAVVPAGGAGTRLWPLSRAHAPKFLHDMTGAGRSLLQQTWDRLQPLVGPDRLMVVTGQVHADAVRAQLPHLSAHNMVLEPAPRDSMAAIGIAAAVLMLRDPDAVIGSFAADQVIADQGAFQDTIRQAVAVAKTGKIVTVGIEPTHPATGFGYVRSGAPLQVPGAPDASEVAEFVEKPDLATAEQYLASGQFRWNAGIFVTRADVLLAQLHSEHPALHDGLMQIARTWGTAAYDQALAQGWHELTKIAIDHAVAEPAAAKGQVATVPGSFGWDDVGDWRSLGDLLEPSTEHSGMKMLGQGEVLTHEARGVVVPAGGRFIAVVGLDDVVVVDTPDAVLVTTRERAQDVKGIVDELKRTGRTELT